MNKDSLKVSPVLDYCCDDGDVYIIVVDVMHNTPYQNRGYYMLGGVSHKFNAQQLTYTMHVMSVLYGLDHFLKVFEASMVKNPAMQKEIDELYQEHIDTSMTP